MSTAYVHFYVVSTGMDLFKLVDRDMPMGDIKEIVAERLGTTPDKLKLLYGGIHLSDDATYNSIRMNQGGDAIDIITTK